jgi:hypothetical protein
MGDDLDTAGVVCGGWMDMYVFSIDKSGVSSIFFDSDIAAERALKPRT